MHKYFFIRKVGACPPMTRYKRAPAPSSTVTSQPYPISTVTNQPSPISMFANYLKPILMFSSHQHQHQISMVASHQQHQASHPQQVPLFHQRLGFAKLLFLLLIGDLQVGITVGISSMKINLSKCFPYHELSLQLGARASTSPRLPRRTTSLSRSASMPSRPSPMIRRAKRDKMGEDKEEEEQCIKYTFYPSSRDGSPALVITECEDQPQLRPCLKPNSRW